jgi:hypothetical protein
MVGRKTEKTRLRRSFAKLRELMRIIRHNKTEDQVSEINQVLRGHYAYYGLGGNHRSLWNVYRFSGKYWHKMLCSRGQKNYIPWEKFSLMKERHPIPIQLPNLRLTLSGMRTLAVL